MAAQRRLWGDGIMIGNRVGKLTEMLEESDVGVF